MKLCVFFLTLLFVACLKAEAKEIPFELRDAYRSQYERMDTLPSDSLQSYLSTTDLTVFYGHPVDSFLSSISNVTMTNDLAPCKNDRIGRTKACVLQVRYYPSVTVEIFVKQFTHMNPYLSSGAWNLTLFKQENISSIRVSVKNDCVNGDCN